MLPLKMKGLQYDADINIELDRGIQQQAATPVISSALQPTKLQVSEGILPLPLLKGKLNSGTKEQTRVNLNPKKQKNTRLSTKASISKKIKRYTPYEMPTTIVENLDERQLMETPIILAEEIEQRALVAIPQQPPNDK